MSPFHEPWFWITFSAPAQQAPRRRPTSTIWKHLAEAVEKTVIQHRALLREPENTAPVHAAEPLESPEPAPPSPNEARQSGRLSDRVREQHAAVHALLDEGLGLRPIAR
ncbi:hypothetical protein Sipo8835_26190 [Streptomyces ipomoeae]|uniref:Uncharacterized protein n=1 Tax=Streptomyces ipomoeae TaxID=103232 RepID=A0AAE8W1R7_9ACTN|nr:hypothetical protein [Streptomyces ipomoeae]TQE28249.1 hypothetical protein Sipo8835_26190 [Streptomyces ipomoeae]